MSSPKVKEPRFDLVLHGLTLNAALCLTESFRSREILPKYVERQIKQQVEVMEKHRDAWKRRHFKCAQHGDRKS